MAKLWNKGRGKLGVFDPLLGTWSASTDSPRGPVRCRRVLEPVLGGSFLQLSARWEMGSVGSGMGYDEKAIIGVDNDGQVCSWSLTSDGKRSQGALADVTDLHAEAVGFEADVPADRVRMAYWPVEDGGCDLRSSQQPCRDGTGLWTTFTRVKKSSNALIIQTADPIRRSALRDVQRVSNIR